MDQYRPTAQLSVYCLWAGQEDRSTTGLRSSQLARRRPGATDEDWAGFTVAHAAHACTRPGPVSLAGVAGRSRSRSRSLVRASWACVRQLPVLYKSSMAWHACPVAHTPARLPLPASVASPRVASRAAPCTTRPRASQLHACWCWTSWHACHASYARTPRHDILACMCMHCCCVSRIPVSYTDRIACTHYTVRGRNERPALHYWCSA